MKKILFFIFVLMGHALLAQHEIRLSVNSGLSAFTGNHSSSQTWINYNPDNIFSDSPIIYANSPAGNRPVLSYGISGNYKRVMGAFLMGLDLGFENLRTKININQYYHKEMIPSEGRSILNGHFLTAGPFVGFRLPVGGLSFDWQAGLDFQQLLKEQFVEKGNFRLSNGKKIKYEKDRSFIRQEIRPRFQLTANYKKMSLYGGYSLGILNYYKDYIGGSPEAKMNSLRFGWQYRIL